MLIIIMESLHCSDTGPRDHALIWDKNFEALQEAIEMAAKSKGKVAFQNKLQSYTAKPQVNVHV